MMNSKKLALAASTLVFLVGSTMTSGARAADGIQALDERQQAIIPVAALTASGDIEKLKTALAEGLDAGLTVNEIKEILVQMYAYAGFPRSLNGLFAFMSVLEERKAKGITDETGKEASPLPADLNRDEYGARIRAMLSGLDEVPPPAEWQKFAPTVDVFLKEHLFADIFARDVLNHQERELATIAALANMTGTAGQLRYHLGAAMNTGLTEAQMQDFIAVMKAEVGEEEAEAASKLLTEILKKRGQ